MINSYLFRQVIKGRIIGKKWGNNKKFKTMSSRKLFTIIFLKPSNFIQVLGDYIDTELNCNGGCLCNSFGNY